LTPSSSASVAFVYWLQTQLLYEATSLRKEHAGFAALPRDMQGDLPTCADLLNRKTPGGNWERK